MIKVQLLNKTSLKIEKKRIRSLINNVAEKLGRKIKGELSLVITDSIEIKNLNKKYRGIDEATNVLSFPIDLKERKEPRMMGDIVVSKNFIKENKNLEELVTHGLLHLLGYDHEKNPQEWNKALKKIK